MQFSGLSHPVGCACRMGVLSCDGGVDGLGASAIRTAVERAAFGGAMGRRRAIQVLGTATVAAAIDQVFPIFRVQEALAETVGTPEKKNLKVGFVAITCATPIILAAPLGFYEYNGLNVEVVRTAGWAAVRDKSLSGD